MSDNGNIVIGYMTDEFLMLDCDLKREDELIEFAKEYTKLYDLGSVLIMKTSDTSQIDLFGNRLGNYCIIFGKKLDWNEIKWHIQQAYKIGIVNKGFLAMRKFGTITIRVNAKNNKIPYPKIVYYYSYGNGKEDKIGIWTFMKFWATLKKEGRNISSI